MSLIAHLVGSAIAIGFYAVIVVAGVFVARRERRQRHAPAPTVLERRVSAQLGYRPSVKAFERACGERRR